MYNSVIEGDLVFQNYGLEGKIVNIFDHVVNIRTEADKGFALIDTKVVNAPYHLKLADVTFKKIQRKLRNNSMIILENDKLTYDNRIVQIDQKEKFFGKIDEIKAIDKEKIIKWTESVIDESPNLGSLDKSILNHKNILNNDVEINLNPLQKQFYKILKLINTEKGHLSELLGLGIGLTPTGDDFVVGYLSAVEAGLIDDKLNIRESLKHFNIFKLTTRVSALHVKGALNHSFNGKIVNLYNNLGSNHKKFIKSAKELLKIGSSSGLDTLSGIYFALTI
jgi:preprotein translocase subunit YajC